jgi:hypothetical protein
VSVHLTKDLFTAREACIFVRPGQKPMGLSTFYRTVRLEIPAYRPAPRTVLWWRRDLEAWMEGHTVKVQEEGPLFDRRTRIGRAMEERRRQERR